jgi:hypothetical protein
MLSGGITMLLPVVVATGVVDTADVVVVVAAVSVEAGAAVVVVVVGAAVVLESVLVVAAVVVEVVAAVVVTVVADEFASAVCPSACTIATDADITVKLAAIRAIVFLMLIFFMF